MPTHFLPDIVMRGTSKKPTLTDAHVYIGLNDGTVIIVNCFDFFRRFSHEPSISTRQSYNPERQLKENFIT